MIAKMTKYFNLWLAGLVCMAMTFGCTQGAKIDTEREEDTKTFDNRPELDLAKKIDIIRARITNQGSKYNLAPKQVLRYTTKRSEPIDYEKLFAAIQDMTGNNLPGFTYDTQNQLVGANDQYEIAVSEDDMFNIMSKTTKYGGQGAFERNYYKARSDRLMASIGALESEMANSTVTTLRAAHRDKARDGRIITSEEALAKKVFYWRTFGGIEVANQQVVVDFNLDGKFLGMFGRWAPINYAKSKLMTRLTDQDFVETAVHALAQSGEVNYQSNNPIEIDTYYEVQRTPDGDNILVLKGVATMHLSGPGGSIVQDQMDFDI